MPDLNEIRSYLVGLGFAIDHTELRAFEDTLKKVSDTIERVSTGMARGFVGAGAAITTALTGVAGSTLALADNISKQDLQFQIFARRMFMATDAAKSMKMATDALGYSIEDIIWGPKELRERYGALITDQGRMMRGLGPDFETQMRRIRDVRFEFTRLQVELSYLAQGVVANLARTFLGGDDKVRDKIRQFNEWLITSMPRLAHEIGAYLAPVLRDVYRIWLDIKDVGRDVISVVLQFIGALYDDPKLKSGNVTLENSARALQHIADSLVHVFDQLKAIADYIAGHKDLAKLLGYSAAGGFVGGPMGAVAGGFMGSVDVATESLETGAQNKLRQQGEIFQLQLLAKVLARKYGIDPAVFQALIKQESGWNPSALNRKSGAMGLGQIMPGNRNMYGLDASIPEQNLEISAHYLADLLRKYHGDWAQVLKQYGGFVTTDPSQYTGSILKGAERYRQGAMYQPQAYHPGMSSRTDVGGITVNVMQPNASPEEIKSAVLAAVEDADRKQAQRRMTEFTTAYA